MNSLLTPRDVDAILRYPSGRAARLARAGRIRHITLPDGEIRFRQEDIHRLLRNEHDSQEGGNDGE